MREAVKDVVQNIVKEEVKRIAAEREEETKSQDGRDGINIAKAINGETKDETSNAKTSDDDDDDEVDYQFLLQNEDEGGHKKAETEYFLKEEIKNDVETEIKEDIESEVLEDVKEVVKDSVREAIQEVNDDDIVDANDVNDVDEAVTFDEEVLSDNAAASDKELDDLGKVYSNLVSLSVLTSLL